MPDADAANAVPQLALLVDIDVAGSVRRLPSMYQVYGKLVVSLNMAGSAPKHADLVVTDPVQAGVVALMAVAETARLDLGRVHGRRF